MAVVLHRRHTITWLILASFMSGNNEFRCFFILFLRCMIVNINMIIMVLSFDKLGVHSLTVDVPNYIHHGNRAVLTCRFDTAIVQLEWQRSEYDQDFNDANELAIYAPSISNWTDSTGGRMTGDIDGMSSTLTIHSVDWLMDDGRYWCKTYNTVNYGQAFASGNTNVSGKFEF